MYTLTNLRKKSRSQSGMTLIEVIVAMVLIQLMIVPILLIMSNLNHYFARATQYSQALFLTQRNLEVSAHLAQTNWSAISTPTSPAGSPFHFDTDAGNWVLKPGKDASTDSRFETWVTIEVVCHDPNYIDVGCDIAGAQVVPEAVKVLSTTTWSYRGSTRDVKLESVYTKLF